MSIGVAILGGGIFAREEHLPAINASRDLTLKAIWSRSLKSARTLEANEKEVNLYSEDSEAGRHLEDLLKRSDISAVVIALPISNQPEYIRKALLAGKHVLSEKPIAENLADAAKLVDWYRREIVASNVTWSIAENYRYLNDIRYAADEVSKSGRVLGFRIRVETLVPAAGKYYETEWRKVPTHQGGFLLDGGVHFVASLRYLLGSANPLVSLSAHTTQLQEHLPPVDTISATLKTKAGVTGTLSISFGTSFSGAEYSLATEKGVITCTGRGEVVTGGETKKIPNERSGVPPEIRAWGEALAAGKSNQAQSPEEALADLEILEGCLRSGEAGGKPVELKYQTIQIGSL